MSFSAPAPLAARPARSTHAARGGVGLNCDRVDCHGTPGQVDRTAGRGRPAAAQAAVTAAPVCRPAAAADSSRSTRAALGRIADHRAAVDRQAASGDIERASGRRPALAANAALPARNRDGEERAAAQTGLGKPAGAAGAADAAQATLSDIAGDRVVIQGKAAGRDINAAALRDAAVGTRPSGPGERTLRPGGAGLAQRDVALDRNVGERGDAAI